MLDEPAAVRTIIISDTTRALLDDRVVGKAFSVGRRLRDLSWEVEVDDDLAFALDHVSCDPDRAIQFLCSQSTRLQ